MECRSLVSAEKSVPVSGLARLDVIGHLEHASVGDTIDVVGRFSRPQGPQNPGEFDFREFLRTSDVFVVVRCEEPEDVRMTHQAPRTWRGWQANLRRHAERLLADQLGERTAGVGTALLLGSRSGITDELKRAFSESGTMHILAISGANVGVLAGLLWLIARVIGCGRLATTAIVMTGIVGYGLLADSQPPVLRAVLMFAAVLSGRPWFRSTPLVNGLALAAIGVLIWNPAHLFDVGAQLSFLAVAALIWAPSWFAGRWRNLFAPTADGDDSPVRSSWPWRVASRSLVTGVVTLAAIRLFTVPMTVARFHLFSPVGLIVNLLLVPVVVVILWSGYALLMLGLVWPALSLPFAALFDRGLQWMLSLVESSAAIEWGHTYLPGPGDRWLWGYYACLAAVACGLPGNRLRRWGWRAMLAWLVGGLGLSLVPRTSDELRCTFLSVGHGLSVLVEMPNGTTLLYDAGQLQNGARARDVVQRAMWERGLRRIDALIVSHADVDHFNGVPGLVRTTPVGEVLMHPTFLDFGQESVRLTCDRLAERHVPMRLIWAGDRLMLDGRVSVRVRHPGANERDRLDNANSLVLEIEHAGRRILLTGDLEQQGLRSLLRQPRQPQDVLLAPHHGSLNANTRALADWSGAQWVVVSGGRNDPSERLRAVYEPAGRVLSTAECGAVTVVISGDGSLRCTPLNKPGSWVY
jgi:competence protein ComEC